MIKITHINGDEKFVTKGAFESIFKPLGYKTIVSKSTKKEEVKENKEELTGKKEDEKEESSKDEIKLEETNKRK